MSKGLFINCVNGRNESVLNHAISLPEGCVLAPGQCGCVCSEGYAIAATARSATVLQVEGK